MNWDAIGAVGEIVGALAVLATLVYLAIQIRQNTKAIDASAFDAAMSGYAQVNLALMDATMASIYRRGNVDPTGLSDDEWVQFLAFGRMWANNMYKMLTMYQRGVFPHDDWVLIATEADHLLKTPGGRAIRESMPGSTKLWAAIEEYSTGTEAVQMGFEIIEESATMTKNRC